MQVGTNTNTRKGVTVLIEPLAREKILAFAEAVTTEIGGLMAVRQEGHDFIVEDAWTVPQEVTAGGVDFETGHFEDHIKAMGWLNGKPVPHICMGTWHSHGDGGTFWSAIDEENLSRKYAMRGFLVNVVVNRRGDWFSQVDSMVGPENGKPEDYVLVTVPSTIELINHREATLTQWVDDQIKLHVRERKIIHPTPNYKSGNYKRDNDWWEGVWLGHDPEPPAIEPKRKRNKGWFAKATRRAPLLKGTWVANEQTQCMEKWSKGKCIAIIDKMGDGALTLYDDDGNTLLTDKHFGSKGYRQWGEV